MPPSDDRQPAAQAAAKWLLALTVGLILYASFYPFNWDWQRLATAQNGGFPTSLPWGVTIRSDVIANLLFYIPLGALLLATTDANMPRWQAFIRTVALGTLLSVCIEFLQHAAPPRAPALKDVMLNCLSTAIGAAGYWIAQRAGTLPQLRARGFDPALYLLLALWAAFHAAPFVPSLRLRQIHDALQPVLAFDVSIGSVARHFAGYLVLSAVLRALVQRQNFWLAFSVAIALSLGSRVLVVGQVLSPNEILGAALALPIVIALRRQPHRRAAVPLAFLYAVAWLIYGLAPFDFRVAAETFHWVPFRGFLESSMDRGYVQFLEKCFLYVGFVWLMTHAGFRTRTTVAMGIVIAALLEVAQRYSPERVAEITDILLILAAGLVVGAGRAIARIPGPIDANAPRR
jgi:VanZ family protein